MSKNQYSKFLLAVPMLLLGSGVAYATGTTLNPGSTALTVIYTLPGVPGPAVTDTFLPTNAATFIYVSTATPAWLTVTASATGGPTAGAVFSFQANAVAGTLEPGTYSGSVTFATTATGYSPATVTIAVTLSVKAPPATFGVSATGGGNLSWFSGQAFPSLTITCTSSGEEIAFSVALGGPIASSMTASVASGIAYEWGSPVVITFAPQMFLSNPPGASLTGTVTLTPNNGAPPVVVNVDINVTVPSVTLTSITPAELPKDLTMDHTLVMTGTGFTQGVSLVYIAIGSAAAGAVDPGHYSVTNSTSIIVTVDHNLYLAATHAAGASTALHYTVRNGATATPTSAVDVVVTTAPIVYAVTNGASFQELPGTNTVAQVSPYELISIFGANFDSGDGTRVNTASALEVYSTSLNNSAAAAVTVGFYNGGHTTAISADTGGSPLALAPMIFVSNTQINCLVPSAVAAQITSGTTALDSTNILVTVGSATNDTVVPVDVYESTPGVFTPAGTGQGIAAVINATGVLNSAASPAVHGTVITIYAAGLGVPNATGVADATGVATRAYPASCVALGSTGYLGILAGSVYPPTAAYGSAASSSYATGSGSGFTTIDGAVIASANLYANLYAPCFTAAAVTVTVQNGANAAVPIASSSIAYAGFVADSIAGLYQINVTLPATFTPTLPVTGTPLTLTLTVNGVSSQPGVTVYVE